MLKVSTNKIVNLHKKSRCPLCLSQALTLGGITPIPLVSKEGKIVPGLAWKDFVLPEDPLEAVGKVKELFSQNGVVGVALKCGVFSRLIVLDIDCPEKFESFYPLQKLIDQAPYVIETKDPGHYHIGFAYDPDLSENRNLLNEAGFELKSNGSLVNFFTVLSEAQYKPLKLEPLRPMPQELKEKLLSLLHKTKSPTPKETPELQKTNIDPQEVIELASEVYLKGQRQYWVIFVAGYLRKLGFSLEEVKEALEDFLKAQNDEELSMRLAGIEHTYKEPIENVKGLFGLLELGLSDKAYLKLQNLKGEREGEHTKYLTIKEIMNLQVKEPSWLIPGFLPEGLSLFAGRPKIGKSWLALQIALTCMQIGKKVVYYALEDTPGRLQKRLKVLGIENPEDLPNLIVFSFELARIGRGAVKEIRKCIEEHKPSLIIIDPWAKIKPMGRGRDIFLEEYQALEVLKSLQREGVSILLIHHTRKSQAEDPIDEVLGSTGQTAVVDNILVLKRGRSSQTAVLHLILRDFETNDLGLKFENGWKIEGKAEETKLAEEQRKIVEAIKTIESMGEKATVKSIAELVNKKPGTVKVALFDLVQKGVILRKERGVYSLLEINKNRANLTNFTNLPNQANQANQANFTNHPLLVSLVSSWNKNELTIPGQNLQGLEEKVSLVSKVSSVSQIDTQPSDPTPDPSFDTKDGGIVYLLMPQNKACERCGCEVWKVQGRDYGKKTGWGKCAKCGYISFLGDLSKGKLLNKTDVEYFLDSFLMQTG